MKSPFNIFHSAHNRKSIPNTWCGRWTDKNGKQVLIALKNNRTYIVSVLDAKGQPYKIDLLGGEQIDTIELLSRFTTDSYDNPILQVEAGSNGVGPTYNLHFLVSKDNQEFRLAKNSDDLSNIIIKPNVGMGLYDDWEDDLGVPWAFPLEDFRKEI